jgi:phospholipid/cholesterol/gamma-HCH transport system ATP-binding protein
VSDVTLDLGMKTVLRKISFTVPVGKKSVVIGPSASGKTVLLKCCAGIFRPTIGTIEVDGLDLRKVDSDRWSANIGFLFQQGGLFDGIPVWENVSFRLISAFGNNRASAKKLALEKLAMVQLSADVADMLPSELSGGMRKRVGLARALATNPSLLLLDDPTAGLDPITATSINSLIEKTHGESRPGTVLATSSDMEAVRKYYDHLYMLNDGMLVWSGPTSQIDAQGNDYVRQLINGRHDGLIKMPLRASS